MELSTNFKEWLYEKIDTALFDYMGTSVYGSELAYKLFEGENVDGSVTYNTYEAKEFIKEYWDDAGEIAEYLKENLGMTVNPFDEPEKFHVCMLLEGASEILAESGFVNEHWNDEMEIDMYSIECIKSDLGMDESLEGISDLSTSLKKEAMDAQFAAKDLVADTHFPDIDHHR